MNCISFLFIPIDPFKMLHTVLSTIMPLLLLLESKNTVEQETWPLVILIRELTHTYTHFNIAQHSDSWGGAVLVMDRNDLWTLGGKHLPHPPESGLRVSTNAMMAWSTAIICATHRWGTKESEREITSRKGEENKQKVEVIRMVLVLICSQCSKCALTGESC